MKDKIKGFLVDVYDNDSRVVEFEETLENMYAMVKCEYIEIPKRYIGGKLYCCVCDEEGLFRSDIRVSMIRKTQDGIEPLLVGNLLITGLENGEGDLTSLTDEDIDNIKRNVYGVMYPIVLGDFELPEN